MERDSFIITQGSSTLRQRICLLFLPENGLKSHLIRPTLSSELSDFERFAKKKLSVRKSFRIPLIRRNGAEQRGRRGIGSNWLFALRQVTHKNCKSISALLIRANVAKVKK